MDEITDPELKAAEERKAHRARRKERQARRKMREEMAAVALAAAAEHARSEAGSVDSAVAETYEDAQPAPRDVDAALAQAYENRPQRARGDAEDVEDAELAEEAAADRGGARADDQSSEDQDRPSEDGGDDGGVAGADAAEAEKASGERAAAQTIDYSAAAAPSKKDANDGVMKKRAGEAEAPSVKPLAKIEPKTIAKAPKPGALAETVPDDAFEIARAQREARMKEIRGELRRRRRLRSLSILVRFLIFVIGPTAFVGWYYYEKATDMYVSESALIFKSGASTIPGAGGLFGSIGGFGNITESVSVQEYIKSRDILERLEAEHGMITHFQSEEIDEFHRLKADASIDEAHKYYNGGFLRSGKVAVSYDTAEGIMRLEVTGATPEAAQRFSQAIIDYSEELVNSLNERSRNDGVRSAEQKVEEAREGLLDAQRKVSEVQEKLNIFSIESEAGALQGRILTAETALAEIDAQIAKLETVAKDPNDSRFVPLRLDRNLKLEELADLRSRLTGGDRANGPSMARLGAELELARTDQLTANLMYTSALNSLETAIATAESQSTYLETVVQPSKPTKADKPARLQNTGLVFLISFAVYILGLLTISLIREQAAI